MRVRFRIGQQVSLLLASSRGRVVQGRIEALSDAGFPTKVRARDGTVYRRTRFQYSVLVSDTMIDEV